MISFKSTGNVDSRLNAYMVDMASKPEISSTLDVRMKFLFEPKYRSGFGKKNDFFSVLNNSNESSKNMVIYTRVSSTKTQQTVRNEGKAELVNDFKSNNSVSLKSSNTSTVTYNDIKWTVDTFDFDSRFTAYTITAVYPNGMVVSIQAKCTNSYKSRINSYLKDLERSIRLEEK